jgi:hypothetical protein
MTNVYRDMPMPLRKSLVEGIVEAETARRNTEGWDQPHTLCFVAMHELERRGDQVMGAQELTEFPFPLDRIPGGPPYEKLENLALAVARFSKVTGNVPPCPEGMSGIAFLAESWMLVGDSSKGAKPPSQGGPMPSESPDRMEALVVTFVDLSGHLCTAMRIRGTEETDVFDFEDLDEKTQEQVMGESRMYPPLLMLAMVYGAAANDV